MKLMDKQIMVENDVLLTKIMLTLVFEIVAVDRINKRYVW